MMAHERARVHDKTNSLLALVPHTDLLRVSDGRVRAVDFIPTPLTEYGVPDRRLFVETLVGTVATDYAWSGFIDEHHLAYTKRDYERIYDGNYPLGAKYRGSELLKINIPRQMHDYAHAVFEKPPMPSEETMRQLIAEQEFINQLYSIVRPQRQLPSWRAAQNGPEQQKHRYLDRLDRIQPGEFGLLPDLEYLSRLELEEACAVLSALARTAKYPHDFSLLMAREI